MIDTSTGSGNAHHPGVPLARHAGASTWDPSGEGRDGRGECAEPCAALSRSEEEWKNGWYIFEVLPYHYIVIISWEFSVETWCRWKEFARKHKMVDWAQNVKCHIMEYNRVDDQHIWDLGKNNWGYIGCRLYTNLWSLCGESMVFQPWTIGSNTGEFHGHAWRRVVG